MNRTVKSGLTRVNPSQSKSSMRKKLARLQLKVEKMCKLPGAPLLALIAVEPAGKVALTGSPSMVDALKGIKGEDLLKVAKPAVLNAVSEGPSKKEVDLRCIDLLIDWEQVNVFNCRNAYSQVVLKKGPGERSSYVLGNRPAYWPEDVPFASHSAKRDDGTGRVMSLNDIRAVLAAFCKDCLQKIKEGWSPINWVSTTTPAELRRYALGNTEELSDMETETAEGEAPAEEEEEEEEEKQQQQHQEQQEEEQGGRSHSVGEEDEEVEEVEEDLWSGPDGALFQAYGHDVWRGEIERLLGDEWLDDTIVNVMLSHALAQSGGKGDTVVVFDSNFAKVLLVPIRYAGSSNKLPMGAFNMLEAAEVAQPISADAQLVLIPVCNNVHWILCALFVQSGELAILCSMGHTYRNVADGLKRYFAPIADKKIDVIHPKVPRQYNSIDCGVFVVEYGQLLIERQAKNADAVDWCNLSFGGSRRRLLLELERLSGCKLIR